MPGMITATRTKGAGEIMGSFPEGPTRAKSGALSQVKTVGNKPQLQTAVTDCATEFSSRIPSETLDPSHVQQRCLLPR
jgi:hypothetical protein